MQWTTWDAVDRVVQDLRVLAGEVNETWSKGTKTPLSLPVALRGLAEELDQAIKAIKQEMTEQ